MSKDNKKHTCGECIHLRSRELYIGKEVHRVPWCAYRATDGRDDVSCHKFARRVG